MPRIDRKPAAPPPEAKMVTREQLEAAGFVVKKVLEKGSLDALGKDAAAGYWCADRDGHGAIRILTHYGQEESFLASGVCLETGGYFEEKRFYLADAYVEVKQALGLLPRNFKSVDKFNHLVGEPLERVIEILAMRRKIRDLEDKLEKERNDNDRRRFAWFPMYPPFGR